MSKQTELEYQGRRIVAIEYKGAFDKSDTMGFDVGVAFAVMDDFDDHALPTSQMQFWSPYDAAAAIRFVDWIGPILKVNKKNWPSTVSYEYNQMLNYRRNFDYVYAALHDIEVMCKDAREFDDNVTEDVLKRLSTLRVAVSEGR